MSLLTLFAFLLQLMKRLNAANSSRVRSKVKITLTALDSISLGDKRPSGSSPKLLNVVKRHGLSALA